MATFWLGKYLFILSPQQPLVLPPYKGSTLRGGFGHAFRRAVCTVRDGECAECLLQEKCIYNYVFETPVPEGTQVLSRIAHVPHPFLIEPPLEEKRVYSPQDRLSFGLILIGRANDYLPYFIFAFEELGRMGLGKREHPEDGKYTVEEVWGVRETGERVLVYSRKGGRILGSVLTASLEGMSARGPWEDPTEVQVSFLTPARLQHQGQYVSARELEFHHLFRSLLGRISSLSYFHCGSRLEVDFREMIAQAQRNVQTGEKRLRWLDWEKVLREAGDPDEAGGVGGRGDLPGKSGTLYALPAAGGACPCGQEHLLWPGENGNRVA